MKMLDGNCLELLLCGQIHKEYVLQGLGMSMKKSLTIMGCIRMQLRIPTVNGQTDPRSSAVAQLVHNQIKSKFQFGNMH